MGVIVQLQWDAVSTQHMADQHLHNTEQPSAQANKDSSNLEPESNLRRCYLLLKWFSEAFRKKYRLKEKNEWYEVYNGAFCKELHAM